MKIFLDDDRVPEDVIGWMYKRIGKLNPIYLRDDWTIVRNYREFVEVVSGAFKHITHVSLDHDLADEHLIDAIDGKIFDDYHQPYEKTGYDAALWIKNFYKGLGMKLPYIYVHTMNPVGYDKIVSVFKTKE